MYLGINPTNQNSIQEEMKSWFNSGNSCCFWCRTFVIEFAIQKYKD